MDHKARTKWGSQPSSIASTIDHLHTAPRPSYTAKSHLLLCPFSSHWSICKRERTGPSTCQDLTICSNPLFPVLEKTWETLLEAGILRSRQFKTGTQMGIYTQQHSLSKPLEEQSMGSNPTGRPQLGEHMRTQTRCSPPKETFLEKLWTWSKIQQMQHYTSTRWLPILDHCKDLKMGY